MIEGESNSHEHLWTEFTDKIIKYLSEKNNNTAFLLMGSYAQQKIQFIDTTKHKIFTCVHPSPFSAYRGFFGSKIFKRINNELPIPIKW